jgi:hypothetical protein
MIISYVREAQENVAQALSIPCQPECVVYRLRGVCNTYEQVLFKCKVENPTLRYRLLEVLINNYNNLSLFSLIHKKPDDAQSYMRYILEMQHYLTRNSTQISHQCLQDSNGERKEIDSFEKTVDVEEFISISSEDSNETTDRKSSDFTLTERSLENELQKTDRTQSEMLLLTQDEILIKYNDLIRNVVASNIDTAISYVTSGIKNQKDFIKTMSEKSELVRKCDQMLLKFMFENYNLIHQNLDRITPDKYRLYQYNILYEFYESARMFLEHNNNDLAKNLVDFVFSLRWNHPIRTTLPVLFDIKDTIIRSLSLKK